MALIVPSLTNGQLLEVGGAIGGSNFIGDVGSTTFISPNNIAVSGLVKWNRSRRHSFRGSLTYTKLEALDRKSSDPRRAERNYQFAKQIIEISGGLEFNFFDFNTFAGGGESTPYLATGISALYHSNFYFNNGVLVPENTKSWAFGIPIIAGYKTTLTDRLILGAEIGVRYSFSDEIDGSLPDSEKLHDDFSFGNLSNNDWYTFTQITLTYTFGRKPCFCEY
jgi:hypothetical protein